MYSLLITAAEGAWDGTQYVLQRSRFLEYTAEDLKTRLASLDASAIEDLLRWPAIFAYETGVGTGARLGRIKKIQVRSDQLRIHFEISHDIPEISEHEFDSLEWDLEIDSYERTRTHWAVKDVDLAECLPARVLVSSMASVGARKKAPEYSRQTVIAATNLLKDLGHTGLDLFLLELGVAELSAGRNLGGLQPRAVALAEFAISHPGNTTKEGERLDVAIIRRAIQLYRSRNYDQVLGPSGDAAAAFLQALERDGHTLEEHRKTFQDNELKGDPSFVSSEPKSDGPALSQAVAGVRRPTPAGPTKVFLVHGRDSGRKHEIARFLERIGLTVVILHEQPNGGRTLISKFREESSDVAFAVVLMTPDDHGGLQGHSELKPRARQNVVFELGFFIGKLGPDRVAALVVGTVEKPSDFEAVVYINFDDNGGWRVDLARELSAAGISFDATRVYS